MMKNLEDVAAHFRDFAAERDWDQYHSPKNLAMALSVEVSELMEHFQWLTQDQSKQLDEDRLAKIAEEIADVQLYLVRLADKLGIDIMDAVNHKMARNRQKYPADKVRGSAKKYTEYDND